MHLLVGVAPTVVAGFHRLDRLLMQLGDECVARRATAEIEHTLQRCGKNAVTEEIRERLLRDLAKRLSRAAELMAECEALAKNDAQLWRRVHVTAERISAALGKKKEPTPQGLTPQQTKMAGRKERRADTGVTQEAGEPKSLVRRRFSGRRAPPPALLAELVR